MIVPSYIPSGKTILLPPPVTKNGRSAERTAPSALSNCSGFCGVIKSRAVPPTLNVDFAIWNSNGVQVDILHAEQGTPDYAELMKLHTVARASYLKADETIADILEHLNN